MKSMKKTAGLDRCVSSMQTMACTGLLKPLASLCAYSYDFCYRHVYQFYICFIACGMDAWMIYEFSEYGLLLREVTEQDAV
jgi:hypothetical protein